LPINDIVELTKLNKPFPHPSPWSQLDLAFSNMEAAPDVFSQKLPLQCLLHPALTPKPWHVT